MKAIIEVSGRGAVFKAASNQVAAARKGHAPDYRLSFESARSLFSDLTPARLDLLDTLRQVGPCSVYALAKAAERNYSNVHTDVARLEELGLAERTEGGEVLVPYEAIEILLPLARAVALANGASAKVPRLRGLSGSKVDRRAVLVKNDSPTPAQPGVDSPSWGS